MSSATGRSASAPPRRPGRASQDGTGSRSKEPAGRAARGVLRTLAKARQPIRESERRDVYDASRGIAVLALLDTLEDPSRRGATSEAVRGFVHGASAGRLAVLLERVGAREAHGVVQGLSRVGLIDAETAETAHARIDLRATPEAAPG
jgi:hypothetical protein